jgi:large subunit ribosomal protein L33
MSNKGGAAAGPVGEPGAARQNCPIFRPVVRFPGQNKPMPQDNLIKLKNAKTGEVIYTRKNKKKLAGSKIELKKFSKKLRKHVVFKEVKK